MIAVIIRLTTNYVEVEDRILLAGEIANSPPAAMWLPQRLALRLLPALFQWLDHQTGVTSNQPSRASRSTAELQKQVVHGFAQEAAKAEFTPQPPVQVAGAGEGWLIHSVDLTPAQDRLALVFRAADGRAVGVALTAMELRQWLAILRGVWLAAGWPASVWPEWIQGEAKPSGQQIVLH